MASSVRLFVVVSGPPASGKSTLAPGLAGELGLPLVAKDTIKDALMSVLPVPDLDTSRQLGRAAVAAMFAVAAQSPCGAVIESVFHRSAAVADLRRLPGRVIEVFCRVDRDGLPPTGAFCLLGVPMDELANRVVGLEELWGRRAVELSERLAGAPSWEARFELVDRALADALDIGQRPDPEVVGAWRELEHRCGDVPIGEIQAATGWSRRRLASRFREQVGLTPKAAARVLRFDRAAELLVRPAPRSLASIALACGYYDQAHFKREFRRLAGCTPSAYLAALYPDAPGAAAAPIAVTQTSNTPRPARS